MQSLTVARCWINFISRKTLPAEKVKGRRRHHRIAGEHQKSFIRNRPKRETSPSEQPERIF
jgi:hypothetical protein